MNYRSKALEVLEEKTALYILYIFFKKFLIGIYKVGFCSSTSSGSIDINKYFEN